MNTAPASGEPRRRRVRDGARPLRRGARPDDELREESRAPLADDVQDDGERPRLREEVRAVEAVAVRADDERRTSRVGVHASADDGDRGVVAGEPFDQPGLRWFS